MSRLVEQKVQESVWFEKRWGPGNVYGQGDGPYGKRVERRVIVDE